MESVTSVASVYARATALVAVRDRDELEASMTITMPHGATIVNSQSEVAAVVCHHPQKRASTRHHHGDVRRRQSLTTAATALPTNCILPGNHPTSTLVTRNHGLGDMATTASSSALTKMNAKAITQFLHHPNEIIVKIFMHVSSPRDLLEIMVLCQRVYSLVPFFIHHVLSHKRGMLDACIMNAATREAMTSLRLLIRTRLYKYRLEPALRAATRNGKLEAFKFLINHPQISNVHHTVLTCLCFNGFVDLLDELMASGKCPYAGLHCGLVTAIESGKLNIVDHLLNKTSVDPSEDQNYALHVAVLSGNKDIVERLLQDDRVNPLSLIDALTHLEDDDDEEILPFDNSMSMLQKAHREGKFNYVLNVLLSDDRLDVTANDSFVFRFACRTGLTSVVEALLRDGRCDPCVNNNEAIESARANGHTETVQVLIKNKKVFDGLVQHHHCRVSSESLLSSIGSQSHTSHSDAYKAVSAIWKDYLL